MSRNRELMLSVRLMTYNHEPFIHHAMEGILSQKINFQCEVVVGDDFSTDKTLEIVKSFQHTKNIHIRILQRVKGDRYWEKRQKLGRLYNFINILENCTGKYIALLDGDDYWTDPLKLQKQVDFLEANEDYAICFHRVYELEDGKELQLSKLNTGENEETYTIEDLAKENFIHTPSVVFRNGLIKNYPKWFNKIPVGDYVGHMLHAQFGKIKYLPEPMAVYRRHPNGIWGNKVNFITH